MSDFDAAPIAAIATPAGNGGVGIVRISGPQLHSLLRPLFGQELAPRLASFTAFLDADGRVIDRGIAIYFPAPHSYTGEDVIELQAHGGQVLMQILLKRVLALDAELGIRLANAGEFTLRAFLNGKIDLTQAEAVLDLIQANSETAVRSAQASLSGFFSARVSTMVEQLIHLRMLVEATLDFPEEEIDFLEASDARGQLLRIKSSLNATLASTRQGVILRQGARIAIAGPPNVGKSSLLNALAGDTLAIVTPVAGTTRDRIHASIQIHGITLDFFDTAGLRETDDDVEKIGILRSYETIDQADLLLWIADAQAPDLHFDQEAINQQVPKLVIFNKIDCCAEADLQKLRAQWPQAIQISARMDLGLEYFKDALLNALGLAQTQAEQSETTFTARTRHVSALTNALIHLQNAQNHADSGNQNLELMAEELRHSQKFLEDITGRFSADDLLGEIFSGFCIGK